MFRKLSWRSIRRATNCAKTTLRSQSGRASLNIGEPEIGPGAYVLLAVPAATFGLGCWQVYRRQWKLNLIEELERLTTAVPMELPKDLRELDNLEYRRVIVRGHFIHEDEQYIGPRADVYSGKTGFHVVTPFKLEDRDMTVLVNRGWVPKTKTNPATRREGQKSEKVELLGVIRTTEHRPPLGAKENRVGPLFAYRQVGEMAQAVGAAPVFLDAVKESSVPGGPVGGQTRVQIRNEHASYIATWYTLSGCTAYMWYTKFGRLLRK